jgi:lysozyme family protein
MTPQQKTTYESNFTTCTLNPAKLAEIDAAVTKIAANKARYQAVATPLNIPWFVVGTLHCMEAGLNFNCHLHNGDPLTARTTHVPKGQPVKGNPPFTWEVSAADALTGNGLNTWKDWSLSGMLYRIECYNGLGYAKKNLPSPYLWSYTNKYTQGKFASDGQYDPNLVSKQCGAAALLKRMADKQLITMPAASGSVVPTPSAVPTAKDQIISAGTKVAYYSGTVSADAKALQDLLNKNGSTLVADGKAGKNTSDAWFKWSGLYLKGDPRRS